MIIKNTIAQLFRSTSLSITLLGTLLGTLLVALPSQVSASEFYVEGSLSLSQPDGGSDSDLELTTTPRIIAGIKLSPNVSAEAGFYYLYTEQGSEEEDIVGQYTISTNSRDILLGLKGQLDISKRIAFYGRAGALLWNTEMEVEEEFYGKIEGGKDSESDNGIGYYLSGGMIIRFNQRLYLDLYLSHHQRDDVFGDDSDYPVDISESIGGVGLGLAF